MSANTRNGCRWECRTTWNSWHGPRKSIPGTDGRSGDVRRCEHGRVWTFERQVESRFFTTHDLWRRVSRILEPLTYRAAIRALDEAAEAS